MNEDLKKELKEIAPFLPVDKPEEGLKVPYNYFDLLPDRVMAKLKEEQQTETITPVQKASRSASRWSFLWQLRPAWAMLGLLLLTMAVILWRYETDRSTDPLQGLTEADIQQYISDNQEDFSEELILETITDEKIEIRIEDTGINKQDIQDYLEDLDPEDMEELF